VTPVELSIDAELIVEIQRFDNDWLFKWYAMTYEGGLTDVEDFRGGRIRLGGVMFGSQQQDIYWQAIDRYMRQKVHAVFKQWDIDSKDYPLATRRASIDGIEQSLHRFVIQILQRSLATDKRLRKGGNPIAHSRPAGQGGVGGEVGYLAGAHRALIDQAIEEQKPKAVPAVPHWKWFERVYNENRGSIWVCTVILVPAVVFAWHYFLG
jgi:hypothetical protein